MATDSGRIGRRALALGALSSAGVAVLQGCHCQSPSDVPPSTSTAPSTAASSAAPSPRLPMSLSLRTSLTGNVLSLDYAYPASLADRFTGTPWEATLLVAIHPASAYPECRRLGSSAVRTEGPAEKEGLITAKAEVDLVAFWGLPPGLLRYCHASFLHAVSDVVRVSG